MAGTGERMRIHLPDKTTQTIDTGPVTIEELLLRLKINPIEVIVSKNGVVVPEDSIAEGGDEIRIIRVVHGG
jgi:sulfur carrier protein